MNELDLAIRKMQKMLLGGDYFMKKIFADKALSLGLILSLLASLLTIVQTVLIILQGDGICLNEGCKIVDSLTTVPPEVFNFVGFLYFQTIFWGLLLSRNSPGLPFMLVKILGVAGMAAEGVLIAFQVFISAVFCSYCLIVFTFIILLNFSFGLRHMSYGAAAFVAVFLAISSLQFRTGENMENLALANGTYGIRTGSPSELKLFVFFSSTCPHCEDVIESLKAKTSCNIYFQPVDSIRGLDFPDLALSPDYSPSENRDFLNALDIEEIPVLMAREDSSIQILKGEQMIQTYLEQSCGGSEASSTNVIGYSTAGQTSFSHETSQDDSCSVVTDCGPLPVGAK